jgi:hypothetical protein
LLEFLNLVGKNTKPQGQNDQKPAPQQETKPTNVIPTRPRDVKPSPAIQVVPIKPAPQPTNKIDVIKPRDRGGKNNWQLKSFIPTGPVKIERGSLLASVAFVGSASRFNLLVNSLVKTEGKQYVDPDFPPSFESLWGFGKAPAHYSKAEWGQYKWKRAVEIFKGPFTVYDDPIDPNDIMQGRLGDCYFLSAICAIAEWQKRVKKLFLTRKVTPEGIFCVALCVNGMWEEVIMDDYFPVTDRGNHYTPAFNRSKKDNLWVMLLEKAWAKVHGGYLNINSGLTREALHDLTGAPSMTFFNDEGTDDERWDMIWNGDRNDFIMAAGTKDLSGQGRDFYEETTGIVGSHAYSMIGCVEIIQEGSEYRVLKNHEKSQGKKVTRLVNLRNPWGKGEWKGDWCSTDKRWNPA